MAEGREHEVESSNPEWRSQFANDPRRDSELYLELVQDRRPVAGIERVGGELFLVVFGCEGVRLPYQWLVDLAPRAQTLL